MPGQNHKGFLLIFILSIFLIGCTPEQEQQFRKKYASEIKEELKNTIKEAITESKTGISIPTSIQPDLSIVPNKASRITSGGSYSADVWGDYIAHTNANPPFRIGNIDIYLYDINTRKTIRITKDSGTQTNPKILDGKIYWEGGGGVMYDIDTGIKYDEAKVPTFEKYVYHEAIYGNKKVVSKEREGYHNQDLFLIDLDTNETTQLTFSEDCSEDDPAIYENLIAYTKMCVGDRWKEDVYVYNLNTKQETRASSDGLLGKRYVKIYKNHIIWIGCDNFNCFGESNNVYLYVYGSEPVEIVKRVIDGDTFELITGDKIRLIGIDTPERGELYYSEARSRLQELLSGKEMRLEKDISETDKYGRLLRYVYIDNQSINELLVKEGFAEASEYKPDIKYASQLKQAEAEAKKNRFGIWS